MSQLKQALSTPGKACYVQVYRGNGGFHTICRVCSAAPRDTFIFRKGWPLTEIVDVEPEVSALLVKKGVFACLCNRCGQVR